MMAPDWAVLPFLKVMLVAADTVNAMPTTLTGPAEGAAMTVLSPELEKLMAAIFSLGAAI